MSQSVNQSVGQSGGLVSDAACSPGDSDDNDGGGDKNDDDDDEAEDDDNEDDADKY